VQVSAECPKEAQDCEPLNAAPTPLDAGDVRRVHLEARCELVLRDLGSIP
jgi:hypothetical protein